MFYSHCKSVRWFYCCCLLLFFLSPVCHNYAGESVTLDYKKLVKAYADAMINNGRDSYGSEHSPMFASALDRGTMKIGKFPDIPGVRNGDRSLSGANPQTEYGLYEILYQLDSLTGSDKYASEADKALKFFFTHCQSPETGLMTWGEHIYWDFNTDSMGGNDGCHEICGEWPFWDQCYLLASDACWKFAIGQWNHQIMDKKTGDFSRHACWSKHGPHGGADFPRYAGQMITCWADAYGRAENRNRPGRDDLAEAVSVVIARMEDNMKKGKAGCLLAGTDKNHSRISWPPSNLELARCIWKYAGKMDDNLADRMRKLALLQDIDFQGLPHMVTAGGGFVSCVDSETGEPRSRSMNKPYTAIWDTGYGHGTHADMANRCYFRYVQLKDNHQELAGNYSKLIIATADQYLVSEPDLKQVLKPSAFAEVITLMLNAYTISGLKKYQERADFFGRLGVTLFLNDGLPLPKATNKHDHYEAITGGPDFMAALLQLSSTGNSHFAIRAYHQHIFPDRQPMSVFHQRLEELAGLDYNMVVFGMGHPGASTITMHKDGSINPVGCSTDDMRKLVAHAVDLGLEPVFEMKFVGKQIPLVHELLEDNPGLVIDSDNSATVLNAAFLMPDGRDAYSATALPLVDYLLNLYPQKHPPRYFHFGIDEFDADDMAVLADKLNMTPPQAFAHCLNIGTDFVIARGVIPVIWGDTLLSKELSEKECGVTLPGFIPDSRHAFAPGGAYHGAYKSDKVTLHTMVNYLRDIDKIIVADWHYSPSSIDEFPSVDYFQNLGFKDVWGCPWKNPRNLHQFCRYAAKRKCGGMMATAWNIAYQQEEKLLLRYIIQSSSAYFHNPFLDAPVDVAAQYTLKGSRGISSADEKRTGIVLHADPVLTFRASVPDKLNPMDSVLLIIPVAGDNAIEKPLIFDAGKREVNTTFTLSGDGEKPLMFQLAYGYTDPDTGLFLYKNCPQGFLFSKVPPLPPLDAKDVLLHGDFGSHPFSTEKYSCWLGGECAVPVVAVSPRKSKTQPRSGGLDTAWIDKAWVSASDYLNHAVCCGMEIDIEAKMTDTFSGDPYCALLTKGCFHSGFRILVHENGKILFQLAGLDNGKPLGVQSSSPIPKNEWVKIKLGYRPPDGAQSGEAYIVVDGQEQGRRSVKTSMQPSTAVLGIGCEFSQPTGKPKGKLRPNFPGLIRSFSIRGVGRGSDIHL